MFSIARVQNRESVRISDRFMKGEEGRVKGRVSTVWSFARMQAGFARFLPMTGLISRMSCKMSPDILVDTSDVFVDVDRYLRRRRRRLRRHRLTYSNTSPDVFVDVDVVFVDID